MTIITRVSGMSGNFYALKNHKIANNSTTAEIREKISADFEYLEF
jgi:hypothetical protein